MTARSHPAHPSPFRLVLWLASATLALATASLAATPGSGGSWVPISPDLGTARAIAFDPKGGGTAYAVFANGLVFVSADRGASWSQAGLVDAAFGRIDCLAVSPGGPNVVYVGTQGGLLKSSDGGLSWVVLAGARTDVFRMAVAPSDSLTIYAGGNGGTDNYAGGLLRTTDGGTTWTPASDLDGGVNALAVDPADPATVYLGGTGFWISHDGGADWAPADPSSQVSNGVIQIIVDPRTPTTLYALTLGGIGGFIERSNDGGLTWSETGPSSLAMAIGLSGSSSLYAVDEFAGVFWSRHGRKPWRQLSTLTSALDPAYVAAEQFPVTVFAVDPGSEVMLVGIYAEGLLRSEGGFSFSSPAGLAALSVIQLLHVPAVPAVPASARSAAGKLFAMTITGRGAAFGLPPSRTMFTNEEGTSIWHLVTLGSSLNPTPSDDLRTPFLAFDATGEVLYLIPSFATASLQSTDRGQTWSTVPSITLPGLLGDLAAVPGKAGRLLVVYAFIGELPPRNQFFESVGIGATFDGGATWSYGTSYPLALPAGNYSTDVLPVPAHLLLDSANPSHLYIAASQLLESTDGGATLTALTLPGSLAAAAIDPTSPHTLYAALAPGAAAILYKSSDGGSTWRRAAHGLPAGATASALAIDPSAPATIYLATDRGVFVTRNAGGTWTALNRGLSGLRVITFAFVPGPAGPAARVYAGTDSAGIFMLLP